MWHFHPDFHDQFVLIREIRVNTVFVWFTPFAVAAWPKLRRKQAQASRGISLG